MKTNSKLLSSFLAAAVLADGRYEDAEKHFISLVAKELDVADLAGEVDAAIAEMQSLSDEAVATRLEQVSAEVAPDEREGILVLCLELLCTDGILSITEVEKYFVFADLLEVDEERAQELLDDFVDDEEEDIVIETEE